MSHNNAELLKKKRNSKMLKLDELSDLENCRVSQLLMIPVDSA